MKAIKGIHHVSAITANAKENLYFYTKVLGMRLVKKTVNQDDTSVYHLFYADERGNPGTDLTFFELPHAGETKRGTQSISETALRVPNDDALKYWVERLNHFQVQHRLIETYGRKAIQFKDFEGQRLQLVSDETNQGVEGGIPWENSPVPQEKGVIGLGPIKITVPRPEKTHRILTDVLGFKQVGSYSIKNDSNNDDVVVFSMGEGGTGGEVHVQPSYNLRAERQGRGSVHHVAFRVEDEDELHKWVEYLKGKGLNNTGFVERYYFRSLYFRDPNGILIELATDGPGFEEDESFEKLGEKLALPPFFEDQRADIEAKLTPLNTKNNT